MRALFFALLLLPGISIAAGQGGSQNSIREMFEQFRSKKSSLGGVVLRGEGKEAAFDSKFLDLTRLDAFAVLQGTKRIRLMWASDPSEKWLLNFNEQLTEVRGGQIDLDLPKLDHQGLYEWTLKSVSTPRKQYAGNWFFYQDIDSQEGQQFLDSLSHAQANAISWRKDAELVCPWMRSEKLAHVNEYCLND